MLILENKSVLKDMLTNLGRTVSDISHEKQVLLVFLRHLGCVFCKEALSDLQKIKHKIDALDTQIVFVHMADPTKAQTFFEEFGLPDAVHISDLTSHFYKEFGLTKGHFKQLFGFSSWIGLGRATLKGNLPTAPVGDTSQMPGLFTIRKDEIIKSFIYKSVGDYPDYLSLVSF